MSSNLLNKPNGCIESAEKAAKPPGLWLLSIAHALGRFGYFSVRSLIVIYAIKHLHRTDVEAYAIFSIFGSLVSGIYSISGRIADRYLGVFPAVILGKVFSVLGILTITLFDSFYELGLSMMIVGAGFSKPNINVLVGSLYEEGSKATDSGFLFFYSILNIGVTAGPLVCAVVAEWMSWRMAFFLSFVAYLLSFVMMLWLPKVAQETFKTKAFRKDFKTINAIGSLIVAMFLVVFSRIMMAKNSLFLVFASGFFLIMIFNVSKILYSSNKKERFAISIILASLPFSTVFFAFRNQSNSVILMTLDRMVDRKLWEYVMPAGFIVSVASMTNIFVAPMLAKVWQFCEKKHISVPLFFKFGMGCALLSIATMPFLWGLRGLSDDCKLMSIRYTLPILLSMSFAELLINPSILSFISRRAPKQYVGFMMGCHGLSISLAYGVSFFIASANHSLNMPGASNFVMKIAEYSGTMQNSCILAAVATAAAFALSLLLRTVS